MIARNLIAGLSLLFVAAGCGGTNPLDRKALDGDVTLDGQPLARGSIEFVPTDGGPVSSGAVIRQGKFAIAEKQGLPPGAYQVRVYSPTRSASPATPEEAIERGDSLEPGIERIPPRYNTATQLTAEVTASGENEFQFTLKIAEP